MKVVIYTKPDCTYCGRAKKLLAIQGIPYQEIVIGTDVTREEFLELIPNAKTVPQIIINITEPSNISSWAWVTAAICFTAKARINDATTPATKPHITAGR